MTKSIAEIWKEIEHRNEKKVSREKICSIGNLNCSLGIIGYTGAKIFILEVNTSIKIPNNYLKKFKGVEIQLVPRNQEKNELTIILNEEELTDVFILFIEDLSEKLVPIKNEWDALTVIHQRINYWRNLFAKIGGIVLSPERQRGLYGELYLLKLLLESGDLISEKIHSWRGAYSANQDFAFKEIAAEVKTTKGKGNEVYVSNEFQLDYKPWEKLFLCIITVNETAGYNRSLSRIVVEILELVSHDPELVREFKEKLELAGLEMDQLEAYNEIEYIIRSVIFYEVREGFPVITRDSLQNEAVSETKYKLDVSGCKKFQIEQELFLNAIK